MLEEAQKIILELDVFNFFQAVVKGLLQCQVLVSESSKILGTTKRSSIRFAIFISVVAFTHTHTHTHTHAYNIYLVLYLYRYCWLMVD